MKLIKNTGNDRVMDALRASLTPTSTLDIATPSFSLFAFGEFITLLQSLVGCRLVLPNVPTDLQLLGSEVDRPFRNQLTTRSLARRCAENMAATQKLLASVIGKKEERAVASLFAPGGTHAMKGEFVGINDFEVVAFLVVLPDQAQ